MVYFSISDITDYIKKNTDRIIARAFFYNVLLCSLFTKRANFVNNEFVIYKSANESFH